jgi:hypothetical protein
MFPVIKVQDSPAYTGRVAFPVKLDCRIVIGVVVAMIDGLWLRITSCETQPEQLDVNTYVSVLGRTRAQICSY